MTGQRGEGFLFNQAPASSNGCGKPGGEYIQLPAFDSIWADGITICAWVRFDEQSYYERIIDFGNGSGDSGGMPIWFGREGTTNNLTLESWISSNGSINRSLGRLTAVNAITHGSIEYYCATIHEDTMRIYVNGVLKAEKKGHPVLNVPRTKNYIAHSNWCANDPDFKGFMDEVRVYNRALSEQEINNLFVQTPSFAPFQSPVPVGQPVQLQAQGGVAYEWWPAARLNHPNIANPVATPLESTTFYCKITLEDGCYYTDSLRVEVSLSNCISGCKGTLGENIYPNGDFGSGLPNVVSTDPGLAPGYIYQTNPPPNDGYYTITNNTSPWGWFAANSWINIEDNGPEPFGYMMVVNASYPPGLFFQHTVPVCENTLYEFSVDVINLFEFNLAPSIKPNLTFIIDSVAYCETGDIPIDAQWHTVRFSFVSTPGQSSVTLAMRNNAPGGYGNDLAIDNISFRACGPEIVTPDTVWYCTGIAAQIPAQMAYLPYANPAFQWQILENGDWQDIPGANAQVLTVPNPQSAATYRLMVASATANLLLPHCSVASKSIQLAPRPPLQVQGIVTDALCAGQNNGTALAQSLSGVAPFAFAWNTGDSTMSVSSLAPGQYTVTVTDAQGCTGQQTISVSAPAPMQVLANGQAANCFGGQDGSALVTASGGTAPYAFVWSNGASGPAASDLGAGQYTVSATDANGCIEVQTVTLTDPPQLAATALGGGISCAGGSNGILYATAQGGTGGYDFQWNTGQNGPQLGNITAGTYTVTITDAQGCTATTSATLNDPPLLTAGATTTAVSCFGGQNGSALATGTGGTGAYTYQWHQGQSSQQVAGLSAGPFSVTLSDANGCTAVANGMITEPPLLTSTASATGVSCFAGNDASAQVAAQGGVTPYTFVWNNGVTGSQINNLSAGQYQVTVTDANGCSSIQQTTAPEPPVLLVTAGADTTDCFAGANGTAWVQVSGGTAPYAYSWQTGETTAQVAGLSAGAYAVTATDAQGCTFALAVTVNQPEMLEWTLQSGAASCAGTADGWLNVQVTGGTGPYDIWWSTEQNGPSVGNLPAGDYNLLITDANGCTATANAAVTEPAVLQTAVTPVHTSCFGGTNGSATVLPAGGTPPYQYVWSNGQTGTMAQNLPAGTYGVTATDAHGCSLSAMAQVMEPTAVLVSTSSVSADCHGAASGTAMAGANGGTPPYSYLWQTGQTTAQLSGLASGWYSLSITDAQQCLQTAQVWVDQPLPLALDALALPVSCPGITDGSCTANASGGVGPYQYVWSTGESGDYIDGLDQGEYSVTVQDVHACTATASETVAVKLYPEVSLGLDQTVLLGEEILLVTHTNIPPNEILDYSWSGDGLTQQCVDCAQIQFLPLENGCERVLVRSIKGCIAEDEMCYRVTFKRRIYVPNVFTPNDDGENDYFTIYSDASVKEIRYLHVYSRWGEHLFQAFHFPTNLESSGWHGDFRGDPMNPGVFVWTAEVEFIDGQVVFLKGDVTLLR